MKYSEKILNEIKETHNYNVLKRQTIISSLENHEVLGPMYLECKNLIWEIAKYNHKKINTKEKTAKLNSLKESLYSEAQKAGYDINFLQNPYSCPACKDKGRVNGKYCKCYYKKLSEYILENSGLSLQKLPDLNNMKFDFLKDEKLINARNQLVKITKEFVNKCDDIGKKTLLICGNVGVGKTHLLHGIVNEGISQNKFVVYSTAFSLNKDFLKYHCAKLEEKDEILSNYLNCDILCIDDLGTENILKNVTCEYLFLIINERLIRNKATVITTNLNLSQIIDIYDERIYSRLKDKQTSIVVNLTGDDIRTMK